VKIIISHDIDHFYWSDHFLKDLFIPKYIIKNTLFLLRRQIPFSLYCARIKSFSSNRFSRLKELVEFNRENEIPATYFMGVNNALNLSYSERTARQIVDFLKINLLPVHLHGIAYNQLDEMRNEREKFIRIAGKGANDHGIRMHYLRNSKTTLDNVATLQYDFDSTLYELKNPFLISNTIEFPVSMMEVYVVQYQDIDFEKVRKDTVNRIQKALEIGLNYFTIIFHDHHFSDSFPLHKKWYERVIQYLKERKFEFTDFKKASADIRLNRQ
jgi:hypothetical protein